MTGRQIKKFRMSLGLSQEKFGEELGMPNPQIQISQFENGTRPVTKRLKKTLDMWASNVALEKKLDQAEHGIGC